MATEFIVRCSECGAEKPWDDPEFTAWWRLHLKQCASALVKRERERPNEERNGGHVSFAR